MNVLIICLFYHSMILTNALVFDDPLFLEGKLGEGYPTFKPLPYVAGLYEVEELFCSGVLISDKHILTVAKCLERVLNASLTYCMNYHAKLGSNCLFLAGLSYYFKAVEVHRKYDFGTGSLNYNIGVITLEIPNYKGKIKQWIPWEKHIIMGENYYLMGWGKGKNHGPSIVQDLQFAAVKLINTQEECLPISKKKNIDREKLICTQLKRKNGRFERSCEMESFDLGAPLVNADGKLLGILCFFKHSQRFSKYGIYIDIHAYDKWITKAKEGKNNKSDRRRIYRTIKAEEITRGANFGEPVGVKQEPGTSTSTSVKHEPIIEDSKTNESVKEEPAMHESVKEESAMHESVKEEPAMHESVKKEPVM